MNKILNDNLTTVGISYQHFNHSRYTTYTIFPPKSGTRYRMPIFIQNHIYLAHRGVLRESQIPPNTVIGCSTLA